MDQTRSSRLGQLGCARPLLVAYFPINDPLVPADRLKAYDSAGVDVIEMGLKAVNPTQDGTIVGASMMRATGKGVVGEASETARRVRSFHNPAAAILFAYAEAPLQAADAEWAEIEGLLCLGSDGAARQTVLSRARWHGTRIIEFLPYTFDQADISRARQAETYVMLHYTPGKTGLRDALDPHLATRLSHLRAEGVIQPIVPGVGISSFDQARDAVQKGANGVVLGSMVLVKAQQSSQALEDYLGRMREVLDCG